MTLNGAGSVVMSNQTGNVFNGPAVTAGGSTLTTSIPITGGGNIGDNDLNITNNSTITASSSAGLTLDPQLTFTNTAKGRAVSNSTLTLAAGTFLNTGGVFRAEGAGAVMDVTYAEIQGGLLTSSDGGEVRFTSRWGFVNGTGSAVTISGAARITNGDTPTFAGNITVDGDLRVDSTGTVTALRIPLSSALTLNGSGTVTLANNVNSQITGSGLNSSLTSNVLIHGAGKIGLAQFDIANGGTINANQTVGLTIDPRTTFVNNAGGAVRSSASGGLTLNGGPFGASNLVVSNFIPVPVIVSFTVVPGTGGHAGQKEMDLLIKGEPGVTYGLDASTNFLDWNPIQSGTAAPITGLLAYEIFVAEATPRYFLRVRLP